MKLTMKSSNPKLLVIPFVIVSAVLILVSIFAWQTASKEYSLSKHQSVAIGTIVDTKAHTGKHGKFYRPVIEFTPSEASGSVTFEEPYTNLDSPNGTKVELIYDSSNPGYARLRGQAVIWDLGIMALILFVFAINLVAIVRAWRKSSESLPGI
jgi:hypothetical protein